MNEFAADSVAIHRLTVRGGQGVLAALRDRVQTADWPVAERDSWVFIRRLHVKGSSRLLPEQLLAQARHTLRERESSDQIVRFTSLADLLAALFSDLARGRAGWRWYWRHWARYFDLPVAQALASLCSEYWAELPAVTARLARQDRLATVWVSLTVAHAGELAAELAGRLGCKLPYRNPLEIRHGAGDVARPGAVAVVEAPIEHAAIRVPPDLLTRWQPVLAAFAEQDDRRQLALLLVAREAAPLLLQRQPAATLASVASHFVPSARRSRQTEKDLSGRPTAASKPTGDVSKAEHTKAEKPPFSELPEQALFSANPIESGNRFEAPASTDATVAADHPQHQPTLMAQRSAAKAPIDHERVYPAQTGTSVENLAADPNPQQQAFANFYTRQGGLLYLLNMVNRPELQRLLLAHAEVLPSAWLWLYRLGQELGLDAVDPLVDFIALQLGLDSREQLAMLPALPEREQILELAQRWYGRTGVWHADLLQLEARIEYSPSHLDMYLPMSAISLPVRLAGLDINPGWLPWLGRVVSFHYD